jgi:hypothetical protein
MKTFSYSLDHAGNRWMGSYASGYGAVNMNDSSQFNLSSSLFIIDPNLGSDYNPAIPTDTLDPPFFVNDQGWIQLDTAISYFQCNGPFACNALLTGGDEAGSEELKLRIARDSSLTSEYIPESKTIAKQYLYDKLQSDTILLNSSSEYRDFINFHETGNIGYLYNVKEAVKEYLLPDSETAISLQVLDSIFALYSDSAFSAPENLRGYFINQLNDLLQSRTSVIQQWKNSVEDKLEDAAYLNAYITGGDEPVMNEKIINEITFQYLKGGNDSIINHYETILQIAQQCPYKAGISVYRARILVSLLNDTIEYNDDVICLQSGIYRNASLPVKYNKPDDIQIIPNPASDKISIVLKNGYAGICRIIIKDITGRTVMMNKYDCESKNHEMNLQFLDSGCYTVWVYLNDSLMVTRKLIVIR